MNQVVKQSRGFVMLYITLLVMSVMLGVAVSTVLLTGRQQAQLFAGSSSSQAYYTAQAGLEDAVYRIKKGVAYTASYTIAVASSTATVTVVSSDGVHTVEAQGDDGTSARKLQATLELDTVNPEFFYGVQAGDGGLNMGNNARVQGNIYSNGNIVGSNGATITGDVTVAGGIATDPSVEWTTQNATQDFATGSANRDIAQSFVASGSAALNKASVYLRKVGAPSADLTLRLAADNSDKPATSALASETILASSVGTTASWIDVAFENPPTLTSGTKYWIILDASAHSATNYWAWAKDGTDGYGANTGKYTGNWSSGGATWTNVGGDLSFRVWIGGVSTRIEEVEIGDETSGTGHANLFVDATIHGSACPNAYCVIENPPREEFPISAGVIQDWRDAAEAGGTCGPPNCGAGEHFTCDAAGNCEVAGGESVTLGPKKIAGNLKLDNGATLTLADTLWVVGEVTLSNNCTVRLDPLYGALSGVFLTDAKATVSNSCAFEGSGQPGSYVMLLSDKNAPAEEVITVDNNALGVIYYAPQGRIRFSNNAGAKEATAYGITLDNNAVITYESGLANARFTSGPGGSFSVKSWREIE
ncbi:MAG: choice-of-anchor R domain-containing protein [bacterium]|nr:choice-of-anchor R domain-containing protein [bacterium]MDZ4296644.1 choice-of-anchor R domain-containing protein [Patescibacteria group bacterium]